MNHTSNFEDLEIRLAPVLIGTEPLESAVEVVAVEMAVAEMTVVENSLARLLKIAKTNDWIDWPEMTLGEDPLVVGTDCENSFPGEIQYLIV